MECRHDRAAHASPPCHRVTLSRMGVTGHAYPLPSAGNRAGSTAVAGPPDQPVCGLLFPLTTVILSRYGNPHNKVHAPCSTEFRSINCLYDESNSPVRARGQSPRAISSRFQPRERPGCCARCCRLSRRTAARSAGSFLRGSASVTGTTMRRKCAAGNFLGTHLCLLHAWPFGRGTKP